MHSKAQEYTFQCMRGRTSLSGMADLEQQQKTPMDRSRVKHPLFHCSPGNDIHLNILSGLTSQPTSEEYKKSSCTRSRTDCKDSAVYAVN